MHTVTCTMQGECDSSCGEEFTYSVLSEELVVGEVYVRVYNEQPTFTLEVSDNVCTYVQLYFRYSVCDVYFSALMLCAVYITIT